MRNTTTRALLAALTTMTLVGPAARPQATQAVFTVEEKTIADVHAAMRRRQLTCRALVETYLARIDAIDKRGPALNASSSSIRRPSPRRTRWTRGSRPAGSSGRCTASRWS